MNRPGLYYAIHVNAFTAKIEGGYRAIDKKKIGAHLTRAELLQALLDNPDAQCAFMKT